MLPSYLRSSSIPPFLPPRLRGRTQNAEPMSKRISSHLKKPKSRSPSPLPFPPDRFGARSAAWGYRASECERSSKKPAEKLVAVSLARPPLPFSPSLSESVVALPLSIFAEAAGTCVASSSPTPFPPFPPRCQSFLLHGGAVFSGMGCVKNRLYVRPAV